MLPEECFDALVEELGETAGVSGPAEPGRRGFGSSALKIRGSIFAMLSHGHLIVKLPASRVATLITDGVGGPFDAGKERPMREWLTLLTDDLDTWRALALEAQEFVGSRSR